MKRFLIVTVLAGFFTLASCTTSDTIQISGKIANGKGTTVKVLDLGTRIAIEPLKVIAKATVDDNGTFSISIDNREAILATIEIGGTKGNYFFDPGDDIHIELSYGKDSIPMLNHTGSAAKYYHFLKEKQKVLVDFNKTLPEDLYGPLGGFPKVLGVKGLDAFEKKNNEYFKLCLNFLYRSDKKHHFSDTFKQMEEAEYYGWYATNKNAYANVVLSMYGPEVQKTIPETYHNYWEKGLKFGKNALLARTHKLLLGFYQRQLNSDNNLPRFAISNEQFVNTIVPAINNSGIPNHHKDFLKASFIFGQATPSAMSNGPDGLEPLMDELRKKESPYIGAIDNTLKTADWKAVYAKRASLEPGNPAVPFTYKDLKGKPVSITDFKGKVVFANIWGTWCGFCKRENPHYLKLKERFLNNDDVVFLRIAIDNKKEWEAYITNPDNDIRKEVNILQDASANILNSYNIPGTPGYLLFDKENNIITTTAPRPSSGEGLYNMIVKAAKSK